jgi:hypothetical protein
MVYPTNYNPMIMSMITTMPQPFQNKVDAAFTDEVTT